MKNFHSPADSIELTVPAGGVISGVGYKIGNFFVVATVTAAFGSRFVGQRVGAIELAKVTAEVWTEGAAINWNDTTKVATTVTTGNYRIGTALKARANPSSTGVVVLDSIGVGSALAVTAESAEEPDPARNPGESLADWEKRILAHRAAKHPVQPEAGDPERLPDEAPADWQRRVLAHRASRGPVVEAGDPDRLPGEPLDVWEMRIVAHRAQRDKDPDRLPGESSADWEKRVAAHRAQRKDPEQLPGESHDDWQKRVAAHRQERRSPDPEQRPGESHADWQKRVAAHRASEPKASTKDR